MTADPDNRRSAGGTEFFRWYEGYRSGRNALLVTGSGKPVDLDPGGFRETEQWREVWTLCTQSPDRPFGDVARAIFDRLGNSR